MTAREVAPLLERYDLGAVHEVRVLEGGMFLKPLLVAAERGRYVLRGHTFRSTEAAFRFQAEVLDSLAAKGVRCPRVVRDRGGRVGEEREGAFWALHEYLGGTLYEWPEWHAAKADPSFVVGLGAQMAGVHNALAEVGSEVGTDGADLSTRLPPIQFGSLEIVRQQWDGRLEELSLEGSRNAPRTAEAFLACRSRLAQHWEWLARQVCQLGVARWARQLVHGDFSPVNLVFDDSGRRFGLIDWDCLHQGIRLYDALGDILSRCPVELAEVAAYEGDKVQRYLEAYSEHARPALRTEELAAVPAFCLARQLEDLRQRLHVLADLPAGRDAEYARLVNARLRVIEGCRAN